MPGRTISGARFASGGLSFGVSRREIVQRRCDSCEERAARGSRRRSAMKWWIRRRGVIAATVGQLRVFSIYAPNGQAVGSPAYEYKLQWYRRLRQCIAKEKFSDLVVCGDFNVAPEDIDVYDAALWRGAIMASDSERAAFRDLCSLGLHDTLRIHHKEGELFSWWDYQMRAFEKNRGLRIDAVLASESLAKRCIASGIDREMRAGKDPSDHAPVWAEFAE